MFNPLLKIACFFTNIFFIPAFFNPAQCQGPITLLNSPDNKLQVEFKIDQPGKENGSNQLVYSVSFNGKQLIKPSALSLDIKGYEPLGSNVSIINSKTSSADNSYKLVVGKTSEAQDETRSRRRICGEDCAG